KMIATTVGLDDSRTRREFLAILYARYADLDPAAALSHLLQLEAPAEQRELVQSHFFYWSQNARDAAIAAVATIDNPHLLQAAGDGVVLAHASPDRLISTDLLALLPITYNPGPAVGWYLGAQAAADPEQAMAQALALYDPILQRAAVHAVASTWAMIAPADALAYAASITDSEARWHFEHPVVDRWLIADRDGLIAALKALPNPDQRKRMLSNAFGEIARREPAVALQIVVADPELRDHTNMILAQWAKRDFAGAVTAAEQHLNASELNSALSWMIRNAAENQPQMAMEWARQRDRDDLFLAAFDGALAADAESAVAYLLGLDELPFQAHDWVNHIGSVAAHDPQLALTLLPRVPQQHHRDVLAQVASSMARSSVSDALAWAESLDPEVAESALRNVIHQWSRHNVEAAAAYIENSGRTGLANAILHEYARQDPGRALDWVLAVTPDNNHNLSMVTQQWAHSDPAGAAAFITQRIDEDWAINAASNMVMNWVSSDATAASAWVATLSFDERNKRVFVRAADALVNTLSFDDALAWANTLETGARDTIVSTLSSRGLVETNRAVALANTIQSPQTRYFAFRNIAYRAPRGSDGRMDMNSVRSVLAGAQLPDEQMSQLMQEIETHEKRRYERPR
ncbi:MAG: hypothetical protein KJO55_02425, partial [Gammaproteobacteria bacterium]|nr:hypothetical protein [Gammaproteobacteria bacterium]